MKRITLLYLMFCCFPFTVFSQEMMLPQVYTEQVEVAGWLVSEKLDGVRGYWDGEKLFSKNGNEFHPPRKFIESLPPFALEGELWGGRGSFEKTLSTVKRQQPHAGWLELQFAIFDVPQEPGGFRQRLQKAKGWFALHPSPYAFVIPQQVIAGHDALLQELHRIEDLGGEGVVVRKADGLYHHGRSAEILKVKSYLDTEAVVVAHIEGKGRNRGRLGALLVELPNKIRFKIGTGFTDAQRENPPPVGCFITLKYFGFYKSGIPKFPSFMRIGPVESDQAIPSR